MPAACRYTNGAFCVPLPRGCVGVMEEGSYAANAIKHCVRPMDMQGELLYFHTAVPAHK